MKYTIEEIKKEFKNEKCVLLTDEYVNNHTLMPYVCECSNQSFISYKKFKIGQRCRKCKNKKIGDAQRFSTDRVRKIFEDSGYDLLEGEKYRRNSVPMRCRCKCGNIFTISLAGVQSPESGTGKCRDCMGKSCRLSHKQVAGYFHKYECELLTEYTTAHSKLDYICDCGNRGQTTWANFNAGKRRCESCRYISGENHYNWNPNRELVKLNCVIGSRCSHMLKSCLNKLGKTKDDRTHKLLGYNRKQLRDHLIQHPNWERRGDRWDIDHIFPVKAFLEHGITDLKKINALDNLQPLPHLENLSKGGKYDFDDFAEYLKIRYEIELATTLPSPTTCIVFLPAVLL